MTTDFRPCLQDLFLRSGRYSSPLHNLPEDGVQDIGKAIDATFEMKEGVYGSFSNATFAYVALDQSKKLDLSASNDHPTSFENHFYEKPKEDETLHPEREEEL